MDLGAVQGPEHVDRLVDVADTPTLPRPTEPDISRMLGAVTAYGIEILGPPMV